MTEAEARAALRAFIGVGDIEPWIARRPWQAVPGGWTVAAASAECEAKGLREALAEARRPFWRRWLG
jgi:hypothetical protein